MGLTILLSDQNSTFYFLSASKHVATESPCLQRNLGLGKKMCYMKFVLVGLC